MLQPSNIKSRKIWNSSCSAHAMGQNCICSCVCWLEELSPPQHPSTLTEEDPQTQQGVKAWLDLWLVPSTKPPGGMILSNVTHTIGGCASHSSCSKCSTGGRWDFSVCILRSPALQFCTGRVWESCLRALPPVSMVKVDLLCGCWEGREGGGDKKQLQPSLCQTCHDFAVLAETLKDPHDLFSAPCPVTVPSWPRTWAP